MQLMHCVPGYEIVNTDLVFNALKSVYFIVQESSFIVSINISLALFGNM
jgi:hypothetical protein